MRIFNFSKFFLLVFVIAGVFLISNAALAVSYLPLVPCGLKPDADGTLLYNGKALDPSYFQPCNKCDVFRLTKNLVDMVFFVIVPVLGTLFFVWAGFLILTAGAIPTNVARGRKIFWGTVQGIAILLLSWLVTNTIIRSLAADDNVAQEWWKFECRSEAFEPQVFPTPTTTTTSGTGGTTTGGGTTGGTTGAGTGTGTGGTGAQQPPPAGTCQGVACTFNSRPDTLSCTPVNPGDNCDQSAVNVFDAEIRAGTRDINVCQGVDTVKLLKAIVANESDGSLTKIGDGGNSAGLFQLNIGTANQYKSACGVSEQITAAWLQRRDTLQQQACIAAKYIQSLAGVCGCDVRQLAAGYNGGGGNACAESSACGSAAASAGGQCSNCPNQNRPTRRWECLWDDTQHKVCNSDRQQGNFAGTRRYAPMVEFCYAYF